MSGQNYWDLLKASESSTRDLLKLVGRDSRPDEAFNAEELNKGTMEEMEHTNDREIAKKIAKDHLEENPKYYSDMEKLMQLGKL